MSPRTPLNKRATPITPDSSRYGSDAVSLTPVRQLKSRLEVEADQAKETIASNRSDIYSAALVSRTRNTSGSEESTINRLHFEVGKLQAQVDNKEQEIRKLEMEKSVLIHTNHDLLEEIADLQVGLRRIKREKDDLGHQLSDLTKNFTDQRAVERQLRQELQKAQMTIKVQSDQIAAPREGASSRFGPKHTTLSQGGAPNQNTRTGSFNDGYEQAPSSFEVARTVTPSRYRATQSVAYHNQPIQHQPFPMRKQSSQRSKPLDSEDNTTTRPSTTPLSMPVPYYNHDHASQGPSQIPLSTSNGWHEGLSSATLSMQPYNGYHSAPVNLIPALTQFFSTVETWAKRYANVPDREADMQMSEALRAQLHQQTNAGLAMSLIASSSTRYFSVTKLILHECAEFAFRPMVVKGFRTEYDNRMFNCRKRAYTGMNYHDRREILTISARIVEEMMDDTGWEEFLGRTTQYKTNETWQLLSALLAPGLAVQEVWSALHSIWHEAIRIGLLMMRTVSIFAVDFPPVGPSSHFIPASMVNRDPKFKENPLALGQMDLKIRLAITPLVTENSFKGSLLLQRPSFYIKYRCRLAVLLLGPLGNEPASKDGPDMPPPLTTKAHCASRNLVKYASIYRAFHDYFVTHLPSSSLHPDSRSSSGPHHQLPRSASKSHHLKGGPAPAPLLQTTRDTTVVRIPLRSAKHHFGVSTSRGTRPYNEDAYQAGVIDVPAFAKRALVNLTRAAAINPLQAYREQQKKAEEDERGKGLGDGEGTSADGASGDPQVFYFGVFDGHGGAECSEYLRERLHRNIEETVHIYGLKSTLEGKDGEAGGSVRPETSSKDTRGSKLTDSSSKPGTKLILPLLKSYKENIGGYFRRFSPPDLSSPDNPPSINTVVTHAFLQTDLTFVLAQIRLTATTDDDRPINYHDSVYSNAPTNNNPPSYHFQPTTSFRGGSTASIAMISTPTPTPFWHPSTPSTLLTAHVGDTRILLSRVQDGAPVPLTTIHHPSTPSEASRLRRWAASFATDSFGEERMSGLANTRAFGDIGSKRMGVSAEPEIRTTELKPSEYAFMVMISDGVSDVMSDQEIIDTVKEAKTPEMGARQLVGFATDVGQGGEEGGDNATALVVRLGGWERRDEGGGGSCRTREERAWRRREAGMGRRGMT
ncbi:MAG: hypothetical protein Q9163_002561 [Psora crenata]